MNSDQLFGITIIKSIALILFPVEFGPARDKRAVFGCRADHLQIRLKSYDHTHTTPTRRLATHALADDAFNSQLGTLGFCQAGASQVPLITYSFGKR